SQERNAPAEKRKSNCTVLFGKTALSGIGESCPRFSRKTKREWTESVSEGEENGKLVKLHMACRKAVLFFSES
ncbi:MAG: hypothetical protein II047_01000, partial [Bacteroidales bacterium]|nr:hypothetical protein [Bacteroidales bacterium]